MQLTVQQLERIEASRQQALERKRRFEQLRNASSQATSSSSEAGAKRRAGVPPEPSGTPLPVPAQPEPAAQHRGESSSDHRTTPSMADLPDRLSRALMPFQCEGVEFGIAQGGRCLIGDEMGLGKTLQAISLACVYRQDWPVLCLMPASIRWVWAEELEKWLPELRPGHVKVVGKGDDIEFGEAKFVIVTFDLVVRCEALRQTIAKFGFRTLIVDESHYCKDGRAKRTQHVLQLARKVKRCFLLSGTPALNRPIELFSQVDMIKKGHFTWKHYTERYCDAKQVFGRWEFKGAKHLSELNEHLASIMIRRRKADVLSQLPEKRRQMVPVELSDQATAKRLEAEYKKWRQMDPGLERNQQWSLCMQETAEAKAPHVAEYVTDLIEGGAKVLVFGHYEKTLDAIVTHLTRKNCQHIRIDGKMAAHDRIEHVRRFQKEAEVRAAVLSVTAAGQGITLTAANTVVFAELRATPGEMQQAEDRAHRIGQLERVSVHYLVAMRTLDETLWSMAGRKIDKVAQALDGQREHYDAEHVKDGCTGSFQSTGDFRPEMCQSIGSKLQARRPGQATGIAAFFQTRSASAHSSPNMSSPTNTGTRPGSHSNAHSSLRGKSNGFSSPESAHATSAIRDGSVRPSAMGGAVAKMSERGQNTEQSLVWRCGVEPPMNECQQVIDLADDDEEEVVMTPPMSQRELGSKCGRKCRAQTPEQDRVICLNGDDSSNDTFQDSMAPASGSRGLRCMGSSRVSRAGALFGVDGGTEEANKQDSSTSFEETNMCAREQTAATQELWGMGDSASWEKPNAEGKGKRETVWVQPSVNTQRMFVYADEAGTELIVRGKPEELLAHVGDWDLSLGTQAGIERGAGREVESGRAKKQWLVKIVTDFAREWAKLRAVEQRRLGNAMIPLPPTLSVAGALQAALMHRAGGGVGGGGDGAGSTVRHRSNLNYDAEGQCGWCGLELSSAGGEGTLLRHRFCSTECKERFDLVRSSGAVRKRLYELERGVCQECGLDAHALFLKIKALPKGQERLSAMMSTKFKLQGRLSHLLQSPNEGHFWQADHIRPVAEGGGEAERLECFRTLCTPCHEAATGQLRHRQADKRRKGSGDYADIRKFFAAP